MTGLTVSLFRRLRRKRWRCDIVAWMRDDKKLTFHNVLRVSKVRWDKGENATALKIIWSDSNEHVGYVPMDGIRTLTELWTPRSPLRNVRDRIGM
jgi:hypothetical protein